MYLCPPAAVAPRAALQCRCSALGFCWLGCVSSSHSPWYLDLTFSVKLSLYKDGAVTDLLKKIVEDTVDCLIIWSIIASWKSDNDARENQWLYVLQATYSEVEYSHIKCLQTLVMLPYLGDFIEEVEVLLSFRNKRAHSFQPLVFLFPCYPFLSPPSERAAGPLPHRPDLVEKTWS